MERHRDHLDARTDNPPGDDAQPVTTPVDPSEYGGEPVCWLPRVCQECGRLADEEPPTRCPGCGAEIGID